MQLYYSWIDNQRHLIQNNRDNSTPMHITILFTIAKIGNHSFTNEWIKENVVYELVR